MNVVASNILSQSLWITEWYGAFMLQADHITHAFRTGLFSSSRMVLNNVSLHIERGNRCGLIGPSGSGKSTLARILAAQLIPNRGTVRYEGKDVFRMDAAGKRRYRCAVQMIFQNPLLSLDPMQKIIDAVREPLMVHNICRTQTQGTDMASELLTRCGISEAVFQRKPCQISGGQAQRVVIARALGLRPDFLIADEPTSMLDISVQAQILRLMMSIQTESGMGILLITHDMDLIRACCDRVVRIQPDGTLVEERPGMDEKIRLTS
uniref:ABC transporter ATP-binding protein n=1 Tax=Desulfatirhabdium butyrativorans TaxID=340467 RepID=A0A7C4MP15_9BACT